jgi:predicted phage terminase large subunit-like protein
MLCGSHDKEFLRGVYDEIIRIISGENGEYLWSDVFPGLRITNTNAKDLQIDIDKQQRFPTFEFSSRGSGKAGKVRARTLLYCDDLVSGIEEALSKDQMDKLWQQYRVDYRQRKIGACKELHIATRWSVYDVLGRLETIYADNPRVRFIQKPAVDENGESNFNYKGIDDKFTTEFYKDMREVLEDADWRALYMNEPIEREGVLYPPDDLRRYFELPGSKYNDDKKLVSFDEPDAIIGICDPKELGTDYAFVPVAYVYGPDYYVDDCLCDNSGLETVDVRMVDVLIRNKVKMARFESNSAGFRTAEKIQEGVKKRDGITHITTIRTKTNKETRIIVNSTWVKEHVLFRDPSSYPNADYKRMMNLLCSWTMSGKNKNDDVPDGMAMLAEFAQNMGGAKVELGQRPW